MMNRSQGWSSARTALAAASVVCLGVAGAARAEGPLSLPSPLVTAGEPQGPVATLTLDRGGYERVRGLDEMVLTGFVLGPGRRVDLEVERFDVFTADARVVLGTAEGDVPLPRPDMVLLRGSIVGEPGSTVFLSLSPLGVNGRVESADRQYLVSSGPMGEGGLVAVYDLGALPEGTIDWLPFRCAADDLPRVMHGAGGPVSRGTPPCRSVTLAIESDWEYTAAVFGGDTSAATAYAATLIGAISEIYTRDVNVRLQVGYVRVWATNTDPYAANAYNRLWEFQSHWNGSMGHVDRHAAHLLSGLRDGSTGGVAWVDALCSGAYAYGLSSFIDGYFPYPLQNNHPQNWDLMVVAHELGHNFGAPHTHDMGIDGCGNGNCAGANQGTIMSYCHTCWGGMSNIVMRLHERTVNEEILPYLNVAPCMTIVEPPAIADQPVGQTVCEGQGASFFVLASGGGDLAFQWRLDGADIDGATGHFYTIGAATPADAGAYDCVVTNACGQAVSDQATLVVNTTCAADFDASCSLSLNDFVAFRNAYTAGDLAADFDGSGTLTLNDFVQFRNQYVAGCP